MKRYSCIVRYSGTFGEARTQRVIIESDREPSAREIRETLHGLPKNSRITNIREITNDKQNKETNK